MNILDAIVNAQNGAAVRQLGSQFGLDEAQVASAVSALAPALAAGFQRNVQSQDGLGQLVSALTNGNHEQYLDDPTSLGDQATVSDGNGILGHIFGSKDVSREVARRASAQTGLSADVMKKMLPLVAALMMGALARSRSASPAAPANTRSGEGITGMLGSLLDRNRDGSMVDDVTSMIGRFLR